MSRPFVSLRIIPIFIRSSGGKEITATCLLDNGAQSSFVTNSLASKIHFKSFRFDYVTRTVGEVSMKFSALYTQVFISSLSQSDAGLEVIEPVQVWAIGNTILDYKSVNWQGLGDSFPHLAEVEVAPLPSKNIDILLGCDVPNLKICLK